LLSLHSRPKSWSLPAIPPLPSSNLRPRHPSAFPQGRGPQQHNSPFRRHVAYTDHNTDTYYSQQIDISIPQSAPDPQPTTGTFKDRQSDQSSDIFYTSQFDNTTIINNHFDDTLHQNQHRPYEQYDYMEDY
jgi:hypothetical protein